MFKNDEGACGWVLEVYEIVIAHMLAKGFYQLRLRIKSVLGICIFGT